MYKLWTPNGLTGERAWVPVLTTKSQENVIVMKMKIKGNHSDRNCGLQIAQTNFESRLTGFTHIDFSFLQNMRICNAFMMELGTKELLLFQTSKTCLEAWQFVCPAKQGPILFEPSFEHRQTTYFVCVVWHSAALYNIGGTKPIQCKYSIHCWLGPSALAD